MKGWVKLNLSYYGKSKKHQIFRAKSWNRSLERIYKKSVYNEHYEKFGNIKEIFGPVTSPFISIKTSEDRKIEPNIKLYVKM